MIIVDDVDVGKGFEDIYQNPLWLHSIDMGKYTEVFQEKDIDEEILLELLKDPEDLNEFGMSDNDKEKLKRQFCKF